MTLRAKISIPNLQTHLGRTFIGLKSYLLFLIQINFPLLPIKKKCASHFLIESTDENKQFKETKHGYLIYKRPVAEFKEFERQFKFKPRFKYGWFHLKLYQMFQDLNRRLI